MPLIPDNRDHGWSPFVWLIFLGFFFFHPIFDHVGWKEWLWTAGGVVAFLVFFFTVFWSCPPRQLLAVGGIAALGMAFAPFNHGASIFFIYTAALIPFATGTSRMALRLLVVLWGGIALEAWLLHAGPDFWLTSYVVSIPVGLSNVFFAQKNRDNAKLRMAHEEIQHLATVAERERIARDLHDVLGHTLSLIALKSELAGKLIERDPARACQEIQEVEHAAREALTEVRAAIAGYRSKGLPEEFTQAQATLETAGVKVNCHAPAVSLQPAQESVLALVLREAVTNVVRHARARNCRLHLEQVNGTCRLQIEDDGRGGFQVEGNGLRGMRERLEAFGGTLERDTRQGTRLLITLPVASGAGSK
jgi:two-component system, NarL family, sensor histidine kinase DesK